MKTSKTPMFSDVRILDFDVKRDPPSDLTDQKKGKKALAGEEKGFCHILTPFPRLRNWYRSTIAEVSLSVCIGADSIWLASIEVDHAYRHQGIGTTVINDLKALADRLALPLYLTPVAETPEWQLCLEAWYSSLGFAWQGELMVYHPRLPQATPTPPRAICGAMRGVLLLDSRVLPEGVQ